MEIRSAQDILTINNERIRELQKKFNPITGENSVGERFKCIIEDFPLHVQFLPETMRKNPFVKQLIEAKSIKKFLSDLNAEYNEENISYVVEQFVRLRYRHDFSFWSASLVKIKAKGGGEDILFRLNRPQRKLVKKLESMRLAGKPIRVVLLKARQWGGSTCIQLYMAWLQLVHCVGLNSLIVANLNVAADEINDMFDKMIQNYPVKYLYQLNESYDEKELKYVGVGESGKIHRVPQRNCKIKVGSAERPDSARGGDYNLVHCSEVGLWKTTEKKTPSQIVRSACSGILYKPYTLIAYESTADGVGSFFHKEYTAAKKGISQFEALFIAWFEIEQYSLEFESESERSDFAIWLWENRLNTEVKSEREESGSYLWWLYNLGATLEAINWYVHERAKYSNHAEMASEYPSDDVEAFAFSGSKVFPDEHIQPFFKTCKPPKFVGEIFGSDDTGEEALDNLRFEAVSNGKLEIWADVEKDPDNDVTDQYLVVVDVCKGHTKKADFADILVIDRTGMMYAENPSVVAEWHGHIDMDMLAWKATQIAEYYNHALLVIESNTLETNNTKGEAEYILNVIRNVYDNLYARKQSAEDIREGRPRKYGYHTNALTKKVVITNLKMILREGLYTERCEDALYEYATYIETDKGGYEAMEGYHDDRLMTRAIGMQVCYNEMELPRLVNKEKTIKAKKKKAVSAATL